MKGKIDSTGVLFIQRGSSLKPMKCRQAGILAAGVNAGVVTATCDDDCPLFGEPEKTWEFTGDELQHKTETDEGTWLEICQDRCLTFTEFEDERE
jgi:hypothetical protein